MGNGFLARRDDAPLPQMEPIKMAKPTTQKFGEFVIAIGDGASPEVFAAPCGLTSKTFNGQADTNDTLVPDCDDPDAPAWKERAVTSLSRDISGDGVLATEFVETWDDWFASGLSKNCKVTTAGHTWTAPYVLSQFTMSGALGDKVKISVSMQSDGQVTRT
ncbi:MAG TPA: phage tail tube protein [Pirellulales bacterium]